MKQKQDVIPITDFTPLVNDFLAERDVSKKTKTVYRGALKVFFDWINQHGIQPITKADILRYKNELRAERKSAYTISLYLSAIRLFYCWLEEHGNKNVARSIKGEKIKKAFKKEPLTRSQVSDLLGAVSSPRDKAIISLMIFTGVRTIELVRANIEDIGNRGDKTVLYIQGKGHAEKDDFVILETPVLATVQNYLSDRTIKIGDPLFVSEQGKRLHGGSISRIVKRALR